MHKTMAVTCIDLSIDMQAFTFKGNPPFTLTKAINRIEGSNPEYVYDYIGCTQTGTHVQGAHYFNRLGKKIDQYPLERFYGLAYMIDWSYSAGTLSLADCKEKMAGYGGQKILVIRSGFMSHRMKHLISDADRCGLSMEAAAYLVELGIQMIGIDAPGVEPRSNKNYEVNVFLGEKDILLLECLSNLELIPSSAFTLSAFPLKITGVEGTPCRAVALINDL